ncbi:hypothetical protein PPERSA_05779 [Pseudocohnilembus persalinus]|uniref:Uncharacterized protein n=1 Tax=Pseudocohnilembus persalinus TaxID=266149 RepID=A0A0V0QZM2_PSEPJ|nr:hypothetical protein PPERSA_05779 [Pseudocohnilembus persalinus]|eukprot:KRX07716.1 hypothetical protein PPERSA_05779 [Pseudocohnilembus persalinus]
MKRKKISNFLNLGNKQKKFKVKQIYKNLNSKKLNEIIQQAKDKEKEIEIKKTDLRECIKEWQGSNKLANTTYGQYLQVKVQKGHANLEEMVYLAMIKKQKQKNKQNNSAFNTLYSSTNHNNQKLSFIQKNAYPRLANYN